MSTVSDKSGGRVRLPVYLPTAPCWPWLTTVRARVSGARVRSV